MSYLLYWTLQKKASHVFLIVSTTGTHLDLDIILTNGAYFNLIINTYS